MPRHDDLPLPISQGLQCRCFFCIAFLYDLQFDQESLSPKEVDHLVRDGFSLRLVAFLQTGIEQAVRIDLNRNGAL